MSSSYTLVDVIMAQSYGMKSTMPGTAENGRLLIARIENGISELWCGTDDGVELLSGAKIDFSNLNTAGEDYFVKTSTQVRDCIFKAPNGLPSVNTNTKIISLSTGTTLLCANGVDSNNAVVNLKTTITSNLSVSMTWTDADAGVVFFNKTNTSLIFYPLSAYGRGTSAPTGSTNMIWYNPNVNKYKITSNLGSTWSDIVATEIARFSTDSNGDIVEFNPYHPLTVATEDDIRTALPIIEYY